jgi:hypothetical protein
MTARAAAAQKQEATEATPASVIDINMTPERALEIVNAYASVSYGWWTLGEAFTVISQREYWQAYLPFNSEQEKYHSFEDFVARRLQANHKTAYRVMKYRAELAALNPDDAAQIIQGNARWLLILKQRLGESKWNKPEIIKQAKAMHEADFKEFCNAKLPGAAKEEEKERFSIVLDRSLKKIHTKAFTVAEWQLKTQGEDTVETPTEQQVYEHILTFYLESQSENHGKGISNLQAFETRSKSKKQKAKATVN